MRLTPSDKGHLTKTAREAASLAIGPRTLYIRINKVFLKHMPREQAKHATRRFIRRWGTIGMVVNG